MKKTIFPVRPGITVKLVGGLGNQLFIAAAGLEQARRLNCPLYLDISAYSSKNDRSFELGNFELKNVFVLPLHVLLIQRLYWKIFKKRKTAKIFSESNNSKDNQIDSIVSGTRLEGYFQSPLYSQNVRKEFIEAINSVNQFTELRSGQISIHLRKGDYLQKRNSEHYGVISSDYVTKCISELPKKNDLDKVVIYCDSPELTSDLASELGAIVIGPRELNNPMQILGELSNSGALVMTNSTLSWWAGCVLSSNSPKSTVFAPDPWFKDLSIDINNLLLPEWQRINTTFE